jgi:hypothetical protein
MAQKRKSREIRRKALDIQKRAEKLRKKRTVTFSLNKKRRNLASKADYEQDKAKRYDVLADKFEKRGE